MKRRSHSIMAQPLKWALVGLVPTLALGCAETTKSPALPETAGTIAFAISETPRNPVQVSTTGYGDYLAALIAGNRNDLSSAADYMQRALGYDPDNPALVRRTFHLLAADGRLAEARVLARQVIESNPEESVANLVLAVEQIEQGEINGAAERLEGLPKRGLDTVMVPLVHSWLLQGQGELDEAVASLEPLRKRDGLSLLADMHTALMYDQAGEPAQAKPSYVKALGDGTRSSLRLTRLAANFYLRNGEPEAAQALFDQARGADEGSSLLEAMAAQDAGQSDSPRPVIRDHKDGAAEVLFNLAGLLSQERAEDVALIYTHQALSLRPDFEMARMLLGEILERKGRDEQAIAAYRLIEPASPLAWVARLRISEALERLERTDDAIRELEIMAAERPDSFEPLYRVGGLLRSQERFGEAVDVYDRAVERLGEPAQRHWSLLYFRGIALERSGDWARAEQDFLKALELQPEQPYVMNYLAYSWVEKKLNLEEAERMLIRAVELRPNDGFIVDSLGWVYFQLGEYDKAVTNLERAVELRPQDPVINDHLGDAFWRVGRRQEARFQWRRSLSLDPEEDLVSVIEAKIDEGLEADPENI
ncbi:MAG: tetratricopeptide repeat protein [Pseudomonadota bacterium]